MATYRVVSDASEVQIHARSSLHAIDGRAAEVTGSLVVNADAGVVSSLTAGRLEVPVSSLRSGNPLEDAEMQRRADARRYPTIVGEVREAAALGDGRFRISGDLTFHGVTQQVGGELSVVAEGDRLRVEGEQVFDVRDFGIKPPRILMLRVEPEVRVSVNLVVEPA